MLSNNIAMIAKMNANRQKREKIGMYRTYRPATYRKSKRHDAMKDLSWRNASIKGVF